MKALLYARVSTIDQKNQGTIDTQIRELQTYCKDHRIEIVHIYKDDGVSANSQERIDDLVDYLQEHQGEFDALVFRSVTRLARDVIKYILFQEACKQMGLTMISTESGVIEYSDDETDPDGTKQLISIIKAWVSGRELKKITTRLLRGRKDKTMVRGIKSQGNCPLGYEYAGMTTKDKHVIVNEREAELVKLMFKTFLETRSTTKTAKLLNEQGYTNKKGNPFTKQNIQLILQNKFYTGVITYNNEERPGKHEAIISKNLFGRVQTVFGAKKKQREE